ncbi:DUF4870 family protein [Aurantiacibacter sp. D1-12]|uniref:DUF4870 family protein n=1 Tax=Aurantiacibacter sp. D1-12 TaxID=2993658 RepID=UPI00237C91BA|nr:hypothetical protein [Aurantiacibacter sp. D1-12]MDE1467331.1 hypothetical protein [Aurantiacibacter sp. D1-12]
MTKTQPRAEGAPPPPPPQADTSVSMQRPVIISILYLLNFVLGFSVIVGVILAYIWRGEERTSEWEQTHYTYLIRTFWIGLLIFVVVFFGWFVAMFGTMWAFEEGPSNGAPPAGFFLLMFGGMGVFLLSAAWFAVRCVLSLVKAGEKRPMPRPETWLF